MRRWLIAGCAALAATIVAAAAMVAVYWFVPGAGWGDGGPSIVTFLLGDRWSALATFVALAVFAVPVVHLTSQVARVGETVRGRRLAAMRLAGATRGDVSKVVSAEALLWSIPGTFVGFAAWQVVLRISPSIVQVDFGPSSRDYDGGSMAVLGPGLLTHPWLQMAAVSLVPMAAAAVVLVTARRPGFEMPRWPDHATGPRARGAIGSAAMFGLVVVVLISLMAILPIPPKWMRITDLLSFVLVLAGAGLIVSTLTLASPHLTRALGRLLAGSGRAELVVAGRMMDRHPRLAANASMSLVLVALVGGAAVTIGSFLEGYVLERARFGGYDMSLASGAPPLEVVLYTVPVTAVQVLIAVCAVLGAAGLLIAVSERVAVRGPAVARQVALGVPRSVLRRALVIETVTPVAIMATIALAVGVLAPAVVAQMAHHPEVLDGLRWGRVAGLWALIVAASSLATWLGGHSLPGAAHPLRIRDRE